MSARIVLRSGKVIDTFESVDAVFRVLAYPEDRSGTLMVWVTTLDGLALVALDAIDAVVSLDDARPAGSRRPTEPRLPDPSRDQDQP